MMRAAGLTLLNFAVAAAYSPYGFFYNACPAPPRRVGVSRLSIGARLPAAADEHHQGSREGEGALG